MMLRICKIVKIPVLVMTCSNALSDLLSNVTVKQRRIEFCFPEFILVILEDLLHQNQNIFIYLII